MDGEFGGWNLWYLAVGTLLGTITGFGLDRLYETFWKDRRNLEVDIEEHLDHGQTYARFSIENAGKTFEPYIDVFMYFVSKPDQVFDVTLLFGLSESLDQSVLKQGRLYIDDSTVCVVYRRINGLSSGDSVSGIVLSDEPLESITIAAKVGNNSNSAILSNGGY